MVKSSFTYSKTIGMFKRTFKSLAKLLQVLLNMSEKCLKHMLKQWKKLNRFFFFNFWKRNPPEVCQDHWLMHRAGTPSQ